MWKERESVCVGALQQGLLDCSYFVPQYSSATLTDNNDNGDQHYKISKNGPELKKKRGKAGRIAHQPSVHNLKEERAQAGARLPRDYTFMLLYHFFLRGANGVIVSTGAGISMSIV